MNDPVSQGARVFEHVAEISLNGATCALRDEVDSSKLPTGMTPYLIEAEIKTMSSANQGIVSWGDFGRSNKVNAFRTDASGTALLNYWWSDDLKADTQEVNLIDGEWHHVMAKFDGVTRKVIVDGTEMGSDTPTGLAVTRTDNFCVGSSNNGEFFTGKMRNIRVFSFKFMVADWDEGPNKNCYGGHGSIDTDSCPRSDWTDLTTEQCKAACLATDGCNGVVVHFTEGKNKCYKRNNMDLSQCVSDARMSAYQLRN